MRFLSNLFSRTVSPSHPEISIASAGRITEAIALLLRNPYQSPNDAEVAAFTRSLQARGIDLAPLRVTTRGGRITYALLPSILPGRTLMLISGTPASAAGRADAEQLVRQVTDEYAKLDLNMMQALLDPQDHISAGIYASCGFRRVAELIYLECPAAPVDWAMPDGMTLESYSPQVHDDFKAAIVSSYEDTLDCPALNGVRSTEDILAGHRAAGAFVEGNWLLVRSSGRPAGVLILAQVPGTQAMELVYIGLAAELRGRGIARQLMRCAMARARESGCRTLTTAVDAANTPAVKMYLRAGMQRIGSRIAMVRVIHAAEAGSSTIHPQSGK